MLSSADVKVRFLEAAEVERRLPSDKVKPDGFSTFWPSFKPTRADLNGWGEKRIEEERAAYWTKEAPPSSDEISRYEECLIWKAEYLTEISHREAIAQWAFCMASGKSFRSWCRMKYGSNNENTGFRRVEYAARRISDGIRKKSVIEAGNGIKLVCANSLSSDMYYAMLEERAVGATLSVWHADDALPSIDPSVWERRRA